MDVHELIRVFLKEENRKELSLYAYMLMGNKNDALDLLSDLLIEIYENPKMQDAIDPIPYFKTVLHNRACNIKKRNSRMIPHAPDMLSGTEPKLYDDTEREHEDMRAAGVAKQTSDIIFARNRRCVSQMLYGWLLGKGACCGTQHERKCVVSTISSYAKENEARLRWGVRNDVVCVNETLIAKKRCG